MGLLKNKIAFILLSIFFVLSGCETKQLFEDKQFASTSKLCLQNFEFHDPIMRLL